MKLDAIFRMGMYFLFFLNFSLSPVWCFVPVGGEQGRKRFGSDLVAYSMGERPYTGTLKLQMVSARQLDHTCFAYMARLLHSMFHRCFTFQNLDEVGEDLPQKADLCVFELFDSQLLGELQSWDGRNSRFVTDILWRVCCVLHPSASVKMHCLRYTAFVLLKHLVGTPGIHRPSDHSKANQHFESRISINFMQQIGVPCC